MNNDLPIPDDVRRILDSYDAKIEFTPDKPNGAVNLAETNIKDDDLRHLIMYPGFAFLCLDNTRIGDEGARHIGEMVSLEALRLDDTLVSDQGVKSLQDLNNLEILSFASTPG